MNKKQMLYATLQKPISFHRIFVDLAGSVNAGLFLSVAFSWQPRDESYFWKTQKDWEEETGLTRREQEGARKRLVGLGLISEERRGVPARMHFRVELDAIMNAVDRLSANQFAQNRQTGLHETAILLDTVPVPSTSTNNAAPGKALVAAWSEAYQQRFSSPYEIQVKDRVAAKRMLNTMTIDDVIELAKWAWSQPSKDWDCQQALTIAGLSSRINPIRAKRAMAGERDLPSRESYVEGKAEL